MNFLDMMDPQKRMMMELMQQQQMQQMLTPDMIKQLQATGAPYAQPYMPEAGTPGYGVIAPASGPEQLAQMQSAAGGQLSMMQSLPGLLSAVQGVMGQQGQEEQAPPPAPPPPSKVGNSKEGLPHGGRTMAPINRKRKFRRQ